MLSDVFDSTKRVAGTKLLSQKYEPSRVSELCTTQSDLDQIRTALDTKRFFAVHSAAGNGATLTTRLVCEEERGLFVHELSCSAGCAEVSRVFKQNMTNVLLALQSQNNKLIFFLKDIEGLHKNERTQILKLVEQRENVVCVCFLNGLSPSCSWPIVHMTDPDPYLKRVHLSWIVAEEQLETELEVIERLAVQSDFRNAINALSVPECFQRDEATFEDFSKILFANETLQTDDLDDLDDLTTLDTFTTLLTCIDTCEFSRTREWFVETTADYVDKHVTYLPKQSFVARHAQLCHRISSLKKACKIIGADSQDIWAYTLLYHHHLMQQVVPFSRTAADYPEKAKALYTIAKVNRSASHCKTLKRTLGI